MRTLLLLIFITLTTITYGQSDLDKAKAYYFQAEEQFENGNAQKTLEYLDRAEKLIGNTNGSIEALRVKTFYKAELFEKAQKSLTVFYEFKGSASNDLLKEMSSYLVKIEDAQKEFERIKNEQELKEVEEKKFFNLNGDWIVKSSDLKGWMKNTIKIIHENNTVKLYDLDGKERLIVTANLIEDNEYKLIFSGEYYARYNYTHKWKSGAKAFLDGYNGTNSGYDRSERRKKYKTWRNFELKYSKKDRLLSWNLPSVKIDYNGRITKNWETYNINIERK